MIDGVTLLIVGCLLYLHFIFDFVLQSHWMASNKSKRMVPLLTHTGIYSSIFFLVGGWKFGLVTFALHTATDYITSRITWRLWAEQKVHNFFVVIGFDQWLHHVQILWCLWMFVKPL